MRIVTLASSVVICVSSGILAGWNEYERVYVAPTLNGRPVNACLPNGRAFTKDGSDCGPDAAYLSANEFCRKQGFKFAWEDRLKTESLARAVSVKELLLTVRIQSGSYTVLRDFVSGKSKQIFKEIYCTNAGFD